MNSLHIITVARVSYSGRLLCFCRVISFFIYHHRFFDITGPIFAKLFHTTRYVLKYFISYMGVHTCHLKILRGENPIFRRFAGPKSILSATSFHNAREIGKSKTIVSICGSIPNMVGVPPPTSEIGCSLGVLDGVGIFCPTFFVCGVCLRHAVGRFFGRAPWLLCVPLSYRIARVWRRLGQAIARLTGVFETTRAKIARFCIVNIKPGEQQTQTQ